ncbi:hypothetical protein [Segnochrobactrum spirostomi]|uniref:Uncharacterized protein n=1 Tax=Segnochrobactrum spirostomi TaxID=2608987 RepID=A0A6A7Y4H6_9HYPH|nr:hypothetical protein [Segnochrobactrum spirostomi]MQT13287.1 hypothetical protein [Segnochrobactrum spirostomi]
MKRLLPPLLLIVAAGFWLWGINDVMLATVSGTPAYQGSSAAALTYGGIKLAVGVVAALLAFRIPQRQQK